MQTLIVALLVVGCSAYVVWSLMAAAARRSTAALLLRLPLPGAVERRLRKATQASSGCACSGCDHAEKKSPPAATQPITVHRRARE